jgi:serine/threonine-protein kinase SRPK3
MIFELITGDFLFEPRKGKTYSKNDDHLAQIIELLGKVPKNMAIAGLNAKVRFELNNIFRNTSTKTEL